MSHLEAQRVREQGDIILKQLCTMDGGCNLKCIQAD